MEDREILDCIHALVAEEHRLRDERDKGLLPEGVEVARVRELEESLDQMWAMLRRRRALRAAGTDPDTVDLDQQLALAHAVELTHPTDVSAVDVSAADVSAVDVTDSAVAPAPVPVQLPRDAGDSLDPAV